MAKRRRISNKMKWLVYALSCLCLVALWQCAAVAIHAPLVLPPPFSVVARLVALCKTASFWHNVAATFFRVVKSFFIVVFFGGAAGILCGVSQRFSAFVAIPLAIVRATPVVSFILLALFWLGTDNVPVFCAVLMALPVMVTSFSSGFAKLDKKLLEMACVFRFSRRQIFRYIYVDELKSFFANGAISSFGMIWKVVAAGEVLSVPRRALGSLMQSAQVHLETADVLAISSMLVALSVACEATAKTVVRALFQRNVRQTIFSAATSIENAKTQPCAVSLQDVSILAGEKKLFEHFSLHISAGERLALIAPSGEGKTTLLNAIASQYGECVSYAFQEPRLLAHCTLLQNVALPLQNEYAQTAAFQRASYFLRVVGLQDRLHAFPHELSGGERQRVAFARALAFPSSVLLLDEAFQSQDVHIKRELVALLQAHLSAEPRTLIFVTHDIPEALRCASRAVVLRGVPVQIVADKPTATLTEDEIVCALRS